MGGTAVIEAFVRGLPKAELHVHLQGAASMATVLGLARRHPDLGVPSTPEELERFYRFRDFAHFIEVYITVNHSSAAADDVQAAGGRARAATWPPRRCATRRSPSPRTATC